MTKKDQIAFIRMKLGSDIKWAIRALERIYEAQTEDERFSEETKEENGVGFTGFDAKFLSSLHEHRHSLTERQQRCLLRLMPKYASQIHKLSDKEKLVAQAMAN